MVTYGTIWYGTSWCGKFRFGLERDAMALYGSVPLTIWYRTASYVPHCTMQYGAVPYNVIWYGNVRYDRVRAGPLYAAASLAPAARLRHTGWLQTLG